MSKVLRVAAIVAAFALTAWIGVVALAQGSSTPTPSPSPSTTTSTTTTATASPSPSGVDDVKGNCDEAEHANDPECQGVTPVAEDDDVNDDQDEDVNDDHGDDGGTTTTKLRTKGTTTRVGTPVPGARTPVPEARTPVPEAPTNSLVTVSATAAHRARPSPSDMRSAP